MSDGLQQVTTSITYRCWLRFRSRAGSWSTTRGGKRGRWGPSGWGRRPRGRWRRRRRRWTATWWHGRWRWRRKRGQGRGRREIRGGGIVVRHRGEGRRGRWSIKPRGRWGGSKTRGWRRGRRCRGRGKVGARVGWGRGHGRSRRRVTGSHHAGTLLVRYSILSIIIGHVWGWWRQEVIRARYRERGTRVKSVGACTLLKTFRTETFSRANAAI